MSANLLDGHTNNLKRELFNSSGLGQSVGFMSCPGCFNHENAA